MLLCCGMLICSPGPITPLRVTSGTSVCPKNYAHGSTSPPIDFYHVLRGNVRKTIANIASETFLKITGEYFTNIRSGGWYMHKKYSTETNT